MHANLYLTSAKHFDPALITERTGLAMDRGITRGEVRTLANGFVRPPATVSKWVHSSGEFERTFDLQGLLNRFLDRIEPVAVELAAVRLEFDLTPTSPSTFRWTMA